MASKTAFRTKGAGVAVCDAVNEAGGKAYQFGDEHALAQGIVTSTFNQTFYLSETDQIDMILALAKKCDATFVAKAAVYGHEVAKMKDSPALMLAVLMARGEHQLLRQAFPRVITRFKMLQNFVQMVRSGKVGRRSFGTVAKTLIRDWLASRTGNALFRGSIGSDPSLADVIRIVHPKPESDEKRALFGYFIGREYNAEHLPPLVREFEAFKKGLAGCDQHAGDTLVSDLGLSVPSVPFQLLSSLPLTEEHWRRIILEMPWNALRMNLNTAARHNAFNDKAVVEAVARKLADPDEVRKNNAFPYQLLTTFQNIGDDIPTKVRNALQDAMEIATENVPKFAGGIAVCVDTSGSMQSPVTGHRTGSTTKTRCVEVAALIGASLARKNEDCILVPFDTSVHIQSSINPRDTIMTNAAKLAGFGGGGTDCACAMRHLNTILRDRPKVVIYVSDNESWYNPDGGGIYRRGTGVAHEWDEYRRKTPGAKLINIDLQTNQTTQILDGHGVMNIGGWSDKMFAAIERFVTQGDADFVRVINESIMLDNAVPHEEISGEIEERTAGG